MVAGGNGQSGVTAPRPVVEEQRSGRENVTILPQPMVVQSVPVMDTLRWIHVTVAPVVRIS